MVHAGKSPRERRRWARARADWSLTIALEDGPHTARMRDVSRAGLSFFLDRPLREMTVLQVRMSLPGRTREVSCSGVVVRCERLSPVVEHYEVAVFLNTISDSDRELLESFVARAESA